MYCPGRGRRNPDIPYVVVPIALHELMETVPGLTDTMLPRRAHDPLDVASAEEQEAFKPIGISLDLVPVKLREVPPNGVFLRQIRRLLLTH
jgi:hypothetical protein